MTLEPLWTSSICTCLPVTTPTRAPMAVRLHFVLILIQFCLLPPSLRRSEGGSFVFRSSASMSPSLSQSPNASPRLEKRSLMPGPRDEPRKRRRWIFIAYDRRERSSPRWKFASEPTFVRCAAPFLFIGWVPWKVARHNSCALLDGNDPVDRHIRQSIHTPARPSDFQRLDLGALPTNQNESADH